MDPNEGETPSHITIERKDIDTMSDMGRTIGNTTLGLAAVGGLAAIGAVVALWRWRGQAVAVSRNTARALAMPVVMADDGPIAGGLAPVAAPMEATADDGPIATTIVLATEPRQYTGSGHLDMAVYSEPGNDERPAEQLDAARHATDEGGQIGAFVDA